MIRRLASGAMWSSLLVLAWVLGYCTPTVDWMPEGIRDMIEVTEIRLVPVDHPPPHVYLNTMSESGYQIVVVGVDELSLMRHTNKPRPLYSYTVDDENQSVLVLINMERMGEAILSLVQKTHLQGVDIEDFSR